MLFCWLVVLVVAVTEVESFFEKRLFFVVRKLRPTEAHFGANKKGSLKKTCNVGRDWLLKKIPINWFNGNLVVKIYFKPAMCTDKSISFDE